MPHSNRVPGLNPGQGPFPVFSRYSASSCSPKACMLGLWAIPCLLPDGSWSRYNQLNWIMLVWKRNGVECSDEILPQVEEFKYLGVLFTSEGRMERETDGRIGRRRSSRIYRSIYVPTLTYGHELWVVTERTRSRIQVAEMGFLRRVSGLSLTGGSHQKRRERPAAIHFQCKLASMSSRRCERRVVSFVSFMSFVSLKS